MSQSPVYIGVDVSKLILAIAGPGLRPEYPNTPAGHCAIIKALPLGAHVVMEATSDYQRAFALALHHACFKVTVANPHAMSATLPRPWASWPRRTKSTPP